MYICLYLNIVILLFQYPHLIRLILGPKIPNQKFFLSLMLYLNIPSFSSSNATVSTHLLLCLLMQQLQYICCGHLYLWT